MDRTHAHEHYSTSLVDGGREEFVALELLRTREGQTRRVARVTYWDAAGQFYVDSLDAGVEIPLVILEELIREAKALIKTK